jgi:Tol biopolymer transport system component
MNEMTDRALRAWLEQDPDRGPSEGLARTLAATRRTSQRPAWIFPERWLPMQLTMARATVPRPVFYAFLAALLAVAVVAAALWVGSQQRRLPPPYGPAANGLIAYERGGVIYVTTTATDSEPVPITEPGRGAFAPVFSRDGARLAFWQRESRSDPLQLIVAHDDGSSGVDVLAGMEIMSLATGGVPDAWSTPVWSPDGSSLAFTTRRGDDYQLVLARSDRKEIRVIATSANELSLPAWSPDGRLIAVREIALNETSPPVVSIVTLAPDGTGRRTLASIEVDEEHVRDMGFMHRLMQWFEWSPKGDRVAYTGGALIASVDLDGRVTELEGGFDSAQFNPYWSPDGSLLAYFANNGETVDVIAPDGSGHRTIGQQLLCAGPLIWSPDGVYILGAALQSGGCSPSTFGQLAAVEVATGQVIAMDDIPTGMPSWQRVAVPDGAP